MRKDGPANLFRDSMLRQYRFALHRMIGRCRVDLPVKVVQECGDSPDLRVFSELFRVRDHAGFDAQHVTAKTFAFDKFANDMPGSISCHAWDYVSSILTEFSLSPCFTEFTTSCPERTWPKTVCFPSSHSVATCVMKN